MNSFYRLFEPSHDSLPTPFTPHLPWTSLDPCPFATCQSLYCWLQCGIDPLVFSLTNTILSLVCCVFPHMFFFLLVLSQKKTIQLRLGVSILTPAPCIITTYWGNIHQIKLLNEVKETPVLFSKGKWTILKSSCRPRLLPKTSNCR